MKILRRLLLALVLPACTAVPAADAPAKATQTHSLWKVQGNKHDVYLLGSIHFLSKTNYPLPDVFDQAYTNSTTIVFEADIGEMENITNALKLLKQTTLSDGETIESQVSAEVYKQFTNYVTEAELPLFMLERFKPAMAAMTLVVLESQKMGLEPEYGIDKHFYTRAKEDSKQIGALETMDFQANLITGLSKEEGEMMLKSTLKELDSLKTELGDVVTAWKTGDSGKLDKLLKEEGEQGTALNKKLVTDRNEQWVPKIEELLKQDKPALVIVGAAHLVGKQGVVELLRNRKWKATQL